MIRIDDKIRSVKIVELLGEASYPGMTNAGGKARKTEWKKGIPNNSEGGYRVGKGLKYENFHQIHDGVYPHFYNISIK